MTRDLCVDKNASTCSLFTSESASTCTRWRGKVLATHVVTEMAHRGDVTLLSCRGNTPFLPWTRHFPQSRCRYVTADRCLFSPHTWWVSSSQPNIWAEVTIPGADVATHLGLWKGTGIDSAPGTQQSRSTEVITLTTYWGMCVRIVRMFKFKISQCVHEYTTQVINKGSNHLIKCSWTGWMWVQIILEG